jgi:voltage-gated potassium channel
MARILRRIHISTLIAAVLSFNGFVNLATGLAPIFRVASYLRMEEVPEYLRLTSGQRFSGILSVFMGVLLIVLGKGLYERRRRAWGWSLAILLVLMANNLYRGTTPQTLILSLILVASLLVFRRRFDVRAEGKLDYGQIVGLASVLFALAYGIVGSYILRAQFNAIENWNDAIYFTFVTYSTLGYGDILPQTANAKIFVISMILIGLTSFVTALTVVLGPILERRMKGVMSIMTRFQRAADHVVVCGYSHVSESVIDELQRREIPYLIVDDREDLIAHLQNKGHDVLLGDATQRETLQQANLGNALAVITAFDQDSMNTLVAVTAKELRDEAKSRFRIVVRVEDEENVEKVQRLGADEVISPSTLGGRMMATRAVETGSA